MPALATTAGAVVATVVAAITITVTTHFAAQVQRDWLQMREPKIDNALALETH